jgi:hypothetical protein
MKESKAFYELAVGSFILAVQIAAYYMFPIWFLASGRLGEAMGYFDTS